MSLGHELRVDDVPIERFESRARFVDFLEGCEARGDEGAADRDALFTILMESACAQVLRDGFMHADPHPGNFLVCEGPKLAVLDFGCVQRFSPGGQPLPGPRTAAHGRRETPAAREGRKRDA